MSAGVDVDSVGVENVNVDGIPATATSLLRRAVRDFGMRAAAIIV